MTASGLLTASLADRYRIERELGAGGMATVYLAEDVRHKRRVAVKPGQQHRNVVITFNWLTELQAKAPR